jgi:hypothetical protein
MQNETLNSMVGLTWMAIKKVFSKPVILVSYLILISLFWVICGFAFNGITYALKEWILLYIIISQIISYFIIIITLSISYNVSLVFLRNENNDIVDLINRFTELSVLFKTILFVFIRSLKFIVPFFMLYIIANPFLIVQVSFYFAISGNNLNPSLIFPIATLVLLITSVLAMYWHIKGIVTVPYGILGNLNYLNAYAASAGAMKGSKLSIFLYFIVLLILYYFILIGIRSLTSVDMDSSFLIGLGSFKSLLIYVFNLIIFLIFQLMYSTMINLLYLKRRSIQ